MQICGIRYGYLRIAQQQTGETTLRGSIIYTHKPMEQYATVCKNVNVGRRKKGKRFSSKCRRYRFFCPRGRYIIEDLHVPLPHTWPVDPHIPAASWMSFAMVAGMAFPMIYRVTSLLPIGRTSGHLSNAINLQATITLRPMGSTYKVHIRLPTKSMAVHSSLEAPWKDEHMHLHAEESIPDRPAAPEVLCAVERMKDPFKSSKITE